jgi:hypothetical protein
LLLLFWMGGLVHFAIFGATATASDPVLVLVFGGSAIQITPFRLFLADLFQVKAPVRSYVVYQALGTAGSVLLALSGASFWVAALPVALAAAVGVAAPGLIVVTRMWGKRTLLEKGVLVTMLVAAAHILNFPFMRKQEDLVVAGFAVNLFNVVMLSILGPAVIFERLHHEERRLRRILDEKERWLTTILSSIAEAVVVTDTRG